MSTMDEEGRSAEGAHGSLDDESRRLDDERRGLDDERRWLDDESRGLDDERRWLRLQTRQTQDGGRRLRVPIAVVGPRGASAGQLALGLAVGEGLARLGLSVVCGGQDGVAAAVAEGAARQGGVVIGLLADGRAELGNPWLSQVLATGLGEARAAVLARVGHCLIAIGSSHATQSEVALALQIGKRVFGLDGAPRLDGVVTLADADEAIDAVARMVVGQASD